MRTLGVLLSLLIGAAAHASDAGMAAYRYAAWAEQDSRPLDALTLYRDALNAGLPDDLVPYAEARFCALRLSIQLDEQIIQYCRNVLRHAGPKGDKHPIIISITLVQMAGIFTIFQDYTNADWAIQEFDRRYGGPDFSDLSGQQQSIDLLRADRLLANGKPREAIAILNQISKEGLFKYKDQPRAELEWQAMNFMRILLFSTGALGDKAALFDAIKRFDHIAMDMRTVEGAEYAAAIMLCQARYLGLDNDPKREVDLTNPALRQLIDLRTDGFLMFMEKAHEKNRQRPLFPPHVMQFVRLCGADAFYMSMPGQIYAILQQQGYDKASFRRMMDLYTAGDLDQLGTKFDALIASLEAQPDPRTELMVKRLRIFREYLLNPPGRTSPG